MVLKRTKIVATLSPKCNSVETIRKFYQAGMNVARLNTAHLALDEAVAMIKNIREVSPEIGIMIDTKGPNIRVAELLEPLDVTAEQEILVSGENVPPGQGFKVSYNRFVDEVNPGMKIVIDDGEVELTVIAKRGNALVCRAVRDGRINNRKSVNVPNAELHTPALTAKDREYIDFAIKNDVDFIAHSFVRDRDDVMAVQSILDTAESPIRIIAKIENRQGVENLEEILDVAYGLMVARGDLGIEIPIEEVPLVQKKLIYECMRRHKPVITATQMLQSMIDNPRPTRAEVSDIANAVLDGSDAIMLSGETAQGDYPVESIEMMSRIAVETEQGGTGHFTHVDSELGDPRRPVRAFMVKSAIEAARKLPIKAIVCNTSSGETCNLCASYRGKAPIFALTYQAHIARRLSLSFGVYANVIEYYEYPRDLMKASMKFLVENNKINRNDEVVILSQLGLQNGSTDMCTILQAKDFGF